MIEKSNLSRFVLGILFTVAIALVGTELAVLPGINRIGAMLSAILIAVIYRNIIGYPEKLREGIQFSARYLLRFAIILYGFKLNIDIVLHQGGKLLIYDVITIVLAIVTTMLMSNVFKGEKSFRFCLELGQGYAVQRLLLPYHQY